MVMLRGGNPRVRLNMLGIHTKKQEATLDDYATVVGINLAFCALAALMIYGFVRYALAITN
jgi:hypothetical protein